MSDTVTPEFIPWTTKDVSASTSTQIAGYIEERIQAYIEDNISGRELYELWNLDFESFSSVEYKKTTAQTKALRDFLRSRNVFIPRKGHSIATELLKAQTTPWARMPDEYLHEIDENHRPINFSSKSPNRLHPDSMRTRVEANNTNSYSFINLMKIYNDEAKYGGSSSDLFDSKFETFCENCDMTCIGVEDRNRAFRFMLKENALEHYRALIRENKGVIPSLDFLYTSIKDIFEGQEHEQMLLATWNELSLQSIINEQEGSKDVGKALATLTTKLRTIQSGLNQSLRNSPFLYAKLLTACRGHPATRAACSTYSSNNSVTDLSNRLQASIATWKAELSVNQQAQVQYPQEIDTEIDQYYTDRRFKGQVNRHIHQNHKRNTQNFEKTKKCFVCRNPNCWSTRHTEKEREEARKRFQLNYQRKSNDTGNRAYLSTSKFEEKLEEFIVESEGQDPDNTDIELLDEFHSFTLVDCQEEAFHTTCGSMTSIQATKVALQLCQQSGEHALTKKTTSVYEKENQAFINEDRYSSAKFHGILIDTGAAGHSTAGYGQYQAFNETFEFYQINSSKTIEIKFGIGTTKSIGSITIPTPIGSCTFHIVNSNTPFLLSLNDLDNKRALFDNLQNFIKLENGFKVPIVRLFGHAFLQWGPTVTTMSYLSESELRTLHRRFGHPSAQRLVNLLNRAGYNEHGHQNLLAKITENCHRCQRNGAAPLRFKFALRDQEIDFNHTIYADIMYIDGSPLLHVVDEATRFQAGRFLPNLSAKAVWEALRICWIDTYLGPPEMINHDAGSNFTASEFQQYNKSLGIKTKEAPIEAAQTMAIVERYHKPLRRAFNIIKEEINSTNKTLILQMAIKAINDTAGPDGIVPTLLVFGTFPRIVNDDVPSANIMTKAKAISKAMEEVSKLRAQRQLKDAIYSRNGPSVDISSIPLGSDVLVWRVHRKQWEGPFKLLGVENESAIIQLPSGPSRFRSTCVKKYNINDLTIESSHEISQLGENDQSCEEDRDKLDNEHEATTERPHRERRIPARYRQDGYLQNDAQLSIFLQQKISNQNNFSISRQKELDGLLAKGVFEYINVKELPKSALLFKSRFVDSIKFPGTPHAIEKSRLVVQAYNDRSKHTVLTQSPTIQRASQRLLLSMAVVRNHSIFSRDINQAYTQSKTNLIRDFYIKPPVELNLPTSIILKVLIPLYGIPEAGNHWFKTYHDHHTKNLLLCESPSDPCLLFNDHAIVGLQTDDTIFCCDENFRVQEQNALIEAGFQGKDVQKLTINHPINFNGAKLTLYADGLISLTQASHCEALSTVKTKEEYIAQRARGAYIASVCQPEASFDLSFAAQATNPSQDNINRLNKRIEWQIFNKNKGLTFVKLIPSKLRLIVFTDSSFANNLDFSSQIGFLIIIADDENCNLIQWSSTKCRRITRSVLASELYAMVAGFDASCAIKNTIDNILKTNIPLTICIDSFSLYECLVKLGTTKEKRLMIDIAAVRQAYERREIAEIVWIKGTSNPADAMTKSVKCNRALQEMILTNKYRLDKEAWVDRSQGE